MPWYMVRFSAAEVAQGKAESFRKQWEEQLRSAWSQGKASPSVAVFADRKYSPPGDMAFFSPEAAALLASTLQYYSAVECPRPHKQNIVLTLGMGDREESGEMDSWAILFPEDNPLQTGSNGNR